MKIQLFCFLCIVQLQILYSSMSFGQTPLDSTDLTPRAGDQYFIKTSDSFNDIISSGINQVWDFSNSIISNDVDTVWCKPIDTNFVQIGGVGKLSDVQLEHSKSSYIEYLGLFSDRIQFEAYFLGNHVIGTQKQKFYKFPINFGDSYQSQFKFDPTGEPWYQEGISFCDVDGYGELHLPGGISYSDVYKIRMIKDGQTVYTFTYPYSIVEAVDTMHVWVKSGIGHPLLIIHSDNWVHDVSSSKVEYLSGYSLLSIGNDEEEFLENIILYPNPSNGLFTLDLPGNSTGDINVYNTLGKLIKTQSISGSKTTLDLTSCTKGIYYLNIRLNDNIYCRKMVIH